MAIVSIDELGRAIHQAKRIGGPWGAACGYPAHWGEGGFTDDKWILVDYDDNSADDGFPCLCRSMAAHLIEIMSLERDERNDE